MPPLTTTVPAKLTATGNHNDNIDDDNASRPPLESIFDDKLLSVFVRPNSTSSSNDIINPANVNASLYTASNDNANQAVRRSARSSAHQV